MDNGRYEPLPRWGHTTVTIGDKVFVWGGRLEDFSEESRQKLAKVVEVFDITLETWRQQTTTGITPPGLYNNAHTVLGSCLYLYGGWDGQSAYSTLFKLDTSTMLWKELFATNPSEAPMKMSGCGMVAYGEDKLVLFGGYGTPTDGMQPGSMFFRQSGGKDDKGWTNQLKVFNINDGTWFTPTTTGTHPPPCVDFTFTRVDGHRAVVFGGYQPETGTVADTYILNMETWHWTKLDDGTDSGAPMRAWPEGRDGHAACVLTGQPSPQLLVSGGWDKNDKALRDAWILDVNAGTWKELTLPPEVGSRFWHSAVAIHYSMRLRQLIMFGGCPGSTEGGVSWPKMAATIVLELGKLNFFAPNGKPSSSEDWMIIDVSDMGQLGQPMRRMREKVLLAEIRAARAEEIARDMTKKLQYSYYRRTPTPSDDSDVFSNLPKQDLPFWSLPREEIQFTGEEIGRGRWAAVRIATYRGVRVAARCLFSPIVSESNRKTFMECMDMAAKLRHPNLLPFIGTVLEGEPIIVTELMPHNLKTVLEKNALAYHQVVNIALQIAKALQFLHTNKPEPVVHGELTSTSILLEQGRGAKWKVKLSDFMTAKFFQQLIAASSSDDELLSPLSTPIRSPLGAIGKKASIIPPGSPTGSMLRKLSITAPEASDPNNLSPKRDVYSYGVLLVEMCTRSSPLEVSLAYLIESITWTSVTALIKKCIEPDPNDRPTMEEVLPTLNELEGTTFAGHSPKT